MRERWLLAALLLWVLPGAVVAKSCGHYVKNGKRHEIPCSLGNGNLKSVVSKPSGCKAQLKINGLTVNLRHQCIVRPSGKTGALSVIEPTGTLKSRQSSLKGKINQLSTRYGVDPALVHAVVTVESAYRSDVVSSKGAIGLMQLMPGTASQLNVSDPFDSSHNLDGGIRYLKQMLKRFNNNEKLALAAYNAGPEAVRKYNNAIPPYPETQDYVKRVMAYWLHYQKDWKKHID